MAKTPDAQTKRGLAQLIAGARAGHSECRWLHALILKYGYAPVARGDEETILATTRQVARLFSVTRATVQNWRRQGLPVHRESSGNQPTLYEIGVVMVWWTKRELAARVRVRETNGAEDEITEAIRREKLRAARRQNDIEEGKVMLVAEVASELGRVARIFRQEAEAVERAHGRVVGDAVRSMIDRSEAEWRKAFQLVGGKSQ